jgi:cellulose synthase/poly-beta-1,6-N-acetylglucosamine synthase-like glycosyltransferase
MGPLMWGSRREEALGPVGDVLPGLPADIAFLARHGVAPGLLAAVAERALRLGVAASREVIASGVLSEVTFYRALADELGLPFVEDRLPFRPGGSYGAILREGVAVVSRSAGSRFSFALAPEGPALRRLLEEGPRRRDDVVVMTPRAFLASLRDANGPALARHAAGLDAVGRARDSARTGSSRGQKVVAGLAVVAASFCGTLAPQETFFAVALMVAPIFLALIFLRLATLLERAPIDLWRSYRWRVDDARLPVYTVAVPLYREEAVLPQLVAALSAIDYPASKLDVLLLTESDDAGMAAALAGMVLPPCFTVLVMPHGEPRTKPRALNLALLEAKGALITIFDAEDIPDPQQLRMAAARFLRAPPDLACLQARLQIDHLGEGVLPALFALEYAGLFEVLNPGLLRYGLPIMLGGTSNHFRTEAVRAVGGWDAWNVTEDADLGLRLVRAGFRIADLPSRTREDAPLTVRAWMKQRSRWIKGYIQTLVTHLHRPGRLLREAGLIAGLTFVTLVFGTVATALGYPLFAAALAYTYGYGALWAPMGFAGGLVATLALSVWLFGALAILGVPALGALRRRAPHLLLLVPLLPAYYALVSVAAWLALYEYLTDRHGWNKTMHGSARPGAGALTDGAATPPPLPPADARC